MKNIFITLLAIVFSINSFSQTSVNSFSQTTTDIKYTKDYYLNRSKNQKTAAWILLGSGIGLAIIGGIVHSTHENSCAQKTFCADINIEGALLTGTGVTMALVSIPFFISSSKNQKKSLTVAINNHNLLLPYKNNFESISQTSLSLKLDLN